MSPERDAVGSLISRAEQARKDMRAEEAVLILEKAIDMFGNQPQLNIDLAKNLIFAGDPLYARRVLETVHHKLDRGNALVPAILYECIGEYAVAANLLANLLNFDEISAILKEHGKDWAIRYIAILCMSGDFKKGLYLANDLSNQLPDDAEIELLTGLILLSLEMLDDAEYKLKNCIKILKNVETTHSMLDEVSISDRALDRFRFMRLIYAGLNNKIFGVVRPLRIEPHEMQSYDVFITRAWKARISRRAAKEFALLNASLNPHVATSDVLLGHEGWLSENRIAADDHYKYAKKNYAEKRVVPYHSNCGAFVWLSEAEYQTNCASELKQKQEDGENYTFIESSNHFDDSICLLVGCDSKYFRFFPSFIYSVALMKAKFKLSRGIIVHCHLANPEPEQVSFLTNLRTYFDAASAGVFVSFSYGPAKYNERSYFTCLRYLIAERVSSQYEKDLFIMDIDLSLNEVFFETLDESLTVNLGLRMDGFQGSMKKQIQGEPWTINAQSMYVRHGLIGRRFLSLIKNYISKAYDTGNIENWTVDQCAIAQAYRTIINEFPQVTVRNMSLFPSIFVTAQSFASKDELIAISGADIHNTIELINKLKC